MCFFNPTGAVTATNPSPERAGPPPRPAAPPWSRTQIRAARMAPLAPLLQKRGLPLLELPAGNFAVATHQGLLIKESYWRWPERNLAGNAIDFFVQVLGCSFHEAMRQITGSAPPEP